MKRRYRLLITATVIAGIAVAFVGLTSLSSASRGPLGAMLQGLGAAAGRIEQSVRRRASGPGRAGQLAWFERYRRDVSLLRKPDSILLGAYDDGIPAHFNGVVQLEQVLGATLPLIQIYGAWGDKPDQRFPLRLVSAIWELGSVPLITWEPWLTDFENTLHPGLPLRTERDRNGMAAVARGDYDFYVDQWARDAASFRRPILLRFGHEMNDPYRYPWGPQHNTKEEYIAAWRHVVQRFRLAGATNVLWVWSPHVAYQYWELYYPGDDVVDWVATGVLNYGPIAQWSLWWTFAEIFGTKYPGLAALGKPVMVAEFGSLSVGGNRAQWYKEALENLPRRYPAVRSLLFFNVGSDQTVTYQKIDWTFGGDTAVVQAIARAMRPWAPGVKPEERRSPAP